jgi:hypothetical protein
MIWDSIRYILKMISWFGFIPAVIYEIGFLLSIYGTFFSAPTLMEVDLSNLKGIFKIIAPFILIGFFLGIIIYL